MRKACLAAILTVGLTSASANAQFVMMGGGVYAGGGFYGPRYRTAPYAYSPAYAPAYAGAFAPGYAPAFAPGFAPAFAPAFSQAFDPMSGYSSPQFGVLDILRILQATRIGDRFIERLPGSDSNLNQRLTGIDGQLKTLNTRLDDLDAKLAKLATHIEESKATRQLVEQHDAVLRKLWEDRPKK